MFLLLAYLFLGIVILLHLFIAQVSDTYQTFNNDADRVILLNKAWMICRMERGFVFNFLLERYPKLWIKCLRERLQRYSASERTEKLDSLMGNHALFRSILSDDKAALFRWYQTTR